MSSLPGCLWKLPRMWQVWKFVLSASLAAHVLAAEPQMRPDNGNHLMFPWLASTAADAMCLSVPGMALDSFDDGFQTLLPASYHFGANQVSCFTRVCKQ